METEKAVLLIAELLDVLVQGIPDCGGDFIEGYHYCEKCKDYSLCRKMTKAQDINSKLQNLIADKSEDVYDAAYRKGFNDAYAGFEDNPYSHVTEPELYGIYERGNIDGA